MEITNTIKTSDQNVSQILTVDTVKIHINKFQRDYTWTLGRSETLLKDLVNHFETYESKGTGNYFLGSIILSSSDGMLSLNGQQEVIDGQQRLITVSLLLAALAKNIENEEKIYSSISVYLTHSGKPIINNRSDVYKAIVLFMNYENIKILYEDEKNFIAVYENFLKLTSGTAYRELLINKTISHVDFIKELRNSIIYSQISVIISNNIYNGSKIFHDTNFKGQSLTEIDLIKNYIFSVAYDLIKDKVGMIEMLDFQWNNIKKKIVSKRETNKFDRVFSSFWTTYYKDFSNINESIYSSFIDKVKFSSFQEIIQFLDSFNEYIDYYNSTIFIDDTEISREAAKIPILESLKFISQTRNELNPIVIPVMKEIHDKKMMKEKNFIWLLGKVEVLIFITSADISIRQRFNIERLLAQFTRASKILIKKGNKIQLFHEAKLLVKELSKFYDYDDFRQIIEKLSYSDAKQRNLVTYFIKKISTHMDGQSNVDPNCNIEHVFNNSGGKEIYNKVGNLLFLETSINSLLGSETKKHLNGLQQKYEYYMTSNKKNVKVFIEEQTKINRGFFKKANKRVAFSESDIDDRTNRLSKYFFDKFVL